MRARRFILIVGFCFVIAFCIVPAHSQDIEICFATADRMVNGETVAPEAKAAGHEACQRALAATSSIMQKQQKKRRTSISSAVQSSRIELGRPGAGPRRLHDDASLVAPHDLLVGKLEVLHAHRAVALEIVVERLLY